MMTEDEEIATETTLYPPYHEPLRKTLRRTIAIALVVGTLLAIVSLFVIRLDEPAPVVWAAGVTAVFWISFGGHWVEMVFLNVVRPRLQWRRGGLTLVRVLVWYAGGTVLLPCAAATATLVLDGGWPTAERLRATALAGGLFFVVVESIVHTILAATGYGNVWNARG